MSASNLPALVSVCPDVLLRVELISMKLVHASSKHPVPPMPTLNGIPRPQLVPNDSLPSSQTAPDLRQSNVPSMGSRSPSPHHVSSPVSPSLSRPDSGFSRNSRDTTPGSMSLTSSMSNLAHSLETQIQEGGNWAQPASHPPPTPSNPARQPSLSEGLDNVRQPRFVGGAPPNRTSNDDTRDVQPRPRPTLPSSQMRSRWRKLAT
jgi:hypothetical protein